MRNERIENGRQMMKICAQMHKSIIHFDRRVFGLTLMEFSFQFITLITCIDFEACLMAANMNTPLPKRGVEFPVTHTQ